MCTDNFPEYPYAVDINFLEKWIVIRETEPINGYCKILQSNAVDGLLRNFYYVNLIEGAVSTNRETTFRLICFLILFSHTEVLQDKSFNLKKESKIDLLCYS